MGNGLGDRASGTRWMARIKGLKRFSVGSEQIFEQACNIKPWFMICHPLLLHRELDLVKQDSGLEKDAVQLSLVAQSCLTLCDSMNRSTPGLPVHHQLPESKPMSTELVMPSNHLIFCRPLLLLPPIFPSIRVFSNESALRISWTKYWNFSLNISPSNELSGLISFRMDWLDFLASGRQMKEETGLLLQQKLRM